MRGISSIWEFHRLQRHNTRSSSRSRTREREEMPVRIAPEGDILRRFEFGGGRFAILAHPGDELPWSPDQRTTGCRLASRHIHSSSRPLVREVPDRQHGTSVCRDSLQSRTWSFPRRRHEGRMVTLILRGRRIVSQVYDFDRAPGRTLRDPSQVLDGLNSSPIDALDEVAWL